MGGTRLQVRALDAERGLVLVHGGDEAAGQAGERLAVLDSTTDDLVVDVGDVAHVGDLVATRTQPALHHVEGHQHPRMADVAVVIDRHATDIQPHPPRFEGLEVFLATGQGVVELERPGHGGSTVGNRKGMKRAGTADNGTGNTRFQVRGGPGKACGHRTCGAHPKRRPGCKDKCTCRPLHALECRTKLRV